MSNNSKLIKKFLTENPQIRDTIKQGLINYSALARLICSTYKIDSFDAVLMSCRRQGQRLAKTGIKDDAVRRLIRNARIIVQTNMAVAIVEKPRNFEKLVSLQQMVKKEGGDISIIEGLDSVTLILSDSWVSEVTNAFRGKILRLREDLVRFNMVFSEKIETTPGVTAYVYRLFAENGINILEEMSCWTDLMILLEEGDMATAASLLRVG